METGCCSENDEEAGLVTVNISVFSLGNIPEVEKDDANKLDDITSALDWVSMSLTIEENNCAVLTTSNVFESVRMPNLNDIDIEELCAIGRMLEESTLVDDIDKKSVMLDKLVVNDTNVPWLKLGVVVNVSKRLETVRLLLDSEKSILEDNETRLLLLVILKLRESTLLKWDSEDIETMTEFATVLLVDAWSKLFEVITEDIMIEARLLVVGSDISKDCEVGNEL